MSGFIPMVSSSPPPMDDSGGFAAWDDDDDDDFGNFASADDSFQTGTTSSGFGTQKVLETKVSSNGPLPDHDDFADFSSFKPVENTVDSFHTVNGEERPTVIELTKEDVVHNSLQKAVDGTENGPLTDSGLYSSEVSPVPQFEDIPGTTKCHTDTDSLDELSTDSSPRKYNQTVECVEEEASTSEDIKGDKGDSMQISPEDFHENVADLVIENDNRIPSEVTDNDTGMTQSEVKPKESELAVETLQDQSAERFDQSTCGSVDTSQNHISIPSSEISSPFPAGPGNSFVTTTGFQQDTEGVNEAQESYMKSSAVPDDGQPVEKDSHTCDAAIDKSVAVGEDTECHHGESYETVPGNSLSMSGKDIDGFIEKPSLVEDSKSLNSCDRTDCENVSGKEQTSVSQPDQDTDNWEENVHEDTQDIEKCSKDSESDENLNSENCSDSCVSTANLEESKNNSSVQHSDNNISKSKDDTYLTTGNTSCDGIVQLQEDCDLKVEGVIEETNFESGHMHQVETVESRDDFGDFLTTDNEGFGDFSEVSKASDTELGASNSSTSIKSQESLVQDNEDFGEFGNTSNATCKNDSDDSKGIIVAEVDFGEFDQPDNEDFGDLGNPSDAVCTNNSDDSKDIVEGEDDFGEFGQPVNADFGDFGNSSNASCTNITDDSVLKEDMAEDDFGEFGQPDNEDFGDFGNPSNATCTNISDDSGSKKDIHLAQDDFDQPNSDDFGDFGNATSSGFANFGAAPAVEADEQTSDWAAFSEPHTADLANDKADMEDEDWSAFDDVADVQKDETMASTVQAAPVQSPVQNMSKSEKIQYAVTACFPAVVHHLSVDVIDLECYLGHLERRREQSLWIQVRDLKTTDALDYQWPKSQWNSRLYSTLHVDTRNVLIGHKKAQVPIFASGLGLLEPTKGPVGASTGGRSEVLVEPSRSDPTSTPPQDNMIPPAEFDWRSSGLTNPLEACNKTLNLDFLIQDQAVKGNALESEFLEMSEPTSHKPAIQPLENILATLNVSSTFRPSNQNEDISKESLKVVGTLPSLTFMTSKVLMFPIKMDK